MIGSVGDARLIGSALAGIAVAIVLIVRGRLHPFLALLSGAFLIGLLAGLSPASTAAAVQKGAGDVLGSTGLVVALGLSLGAMLHLSDGAGSLARAGLSLCGPRAAPWMSMAVAMLVGLPLFFETGLVLLVPVASAAAAGLAEEALPGARLRLVLPTLTGLSVVHALVPPHPGPLLAIDMLHANVGRTLLYGLAVGVPTAIVAGPLYARFIAGRVGPAAASMEPAAAALAAAPLGRALLTILLPVALIAAGQAGAVLLPGAAWPGLIGNPVAALVITNLLALPLLFGRAMRDAAVQDRIWADAMRPAGGVILAIGAGGSLKQVLIGAGLADFLARFATASHVSTIVMAWLVAASIRLATGSATVATITAAGVMGTVVAATGASPEWTVLAIGAGSVILSHVNDPGFWLVRSYLGTSTADTFRTWSAVETIIAVVGLVLVFAGSLVV
jgi:gluconate:H+ symporter, GntP family